MPRRPGRESGRAARLGRRRGRKGLRPSSRGGRARRAAAEYQPGYDGLPGGAQGLRAPGGNASRAGLFRPVACPLPRGGRGACSHSFSYTYSYTPIRDSRQDSSVRVGVRVRQTRDSHTHTLPPPHTLSACRRPITRPPFILLADGRRLAYTRGSSMRGLSLRLSKPLGSRCGKD